MDKIIPAEGIIGELALREAAKEMRDLIELVRGALAKKLAKQMGRNDCDSYWIDMEAIYADRAVIKVLGRYYAHPYVINEQNIVELGDPAEVTREFTPVSASMRESVALIEAVGNAEKPSSFLIRVIKAGTSANGKIYPAAVLREAAPLFNGARVFIKADEVHLEGKGKDVRNLIGGLRDATFIEAGGGEIQAVLDVFDSEAVVSGKLREAVARGMSNLFGFSVDCEGEARRKGKFFEAVRFTKVHSVDLIVEPGAGGELINFIEALASQPPHEDDAMLKRLIEAIRLANNGKLPDGLDESNEDQVLAAYREAVKTPAAAPIDTSKFVSKDDLQQLETRTAMREAVRTSGLPEKAQAKLVQQLEADPQLTTARFQEAITEEREYLAAFTESGNVRGLGGVPGAVTVGVKGIEEMIGKLFDPKDREVISLRECYVAATGDSKVTGRTSNMRFVEAIDSTTFPVMLGDTLNRRILEMYNNTTRDDLWREIVGPSGIVPLNDFRSRKAIMYGGFGDLPTVAENGAYAELAAPSEMPESYTPVKKGGLVTVSLETIKNDDVGFVMKIPQNVAGAAKRTLNKFVLDFIRTNPLLDDGTALFALARGNLGSVAFSKAEYIAGRLAMQLMQDPDIAEALGLTPHLLLIPFQLEETAFDAFRRDTNVDPDFAQSSAPKIRTVDYWSDANDWATVCDPAVHPTIEVGFLDGKQEPELFIQDNPTQGSLFTNDQIRWKVRHIYGGTPVSYIGMRKNVVA